MARKKAPAGRKRIGLSNSYIQSQVEKRIKKLKKNKVYGKFASRKIVGLFRSEDIKLNKKGKIKLNWRKLKPIKIRKIRKVFSEFLKAKTSEISGIEEKRRITRDRLKISLSGLVDEPLSDEDVDDFYELVQDDDFNYLADKIGDSEAYTILKSTQREASSQKDASEMLKSKLEQYMTITNSSDAYNKLENLYNKWF